EDDATTSSELLAAQLGARVVKAFNTIHFQSLGSDGRPGSSRDERLAIPFAGDDADAKARTAGLIDELGFAPLAAGSLAEGGRLMQPGAPFFNRPLLLPEAERELAGLRDRADPAVVPRSLVLATDLDVLAPDSVVERRDGYLLVRSPSNPTFYWGNFLLF